MPLSEFEMRCNCCSHATNISKGFMQSIFFFLSVYCMSSLLLMIMQNKIGADIIMALDDVVKTTITGPRIEEAMYRTIRWIDRCIAGICMAHNVTHFFTNRTKIQITKL